MQHKNHVVPDEQLRALFMQLFNHLSQPFMSSGDHRIQSVDIYYLLSKYVYDIGPDRVIYTENLRRALKELHDIYVPYVEELVGRYENRPVEGSSYHTTGYELGQNILRASLEKLHAMAKVNEYLSLVEVANRQKTLADRQSRHSRIGVAKSLLTEKVDWLAHLLDVFIVETYDETAEALTGIDILSRNLPKSTDGYEKVRKPESITFPKDFPRDHWSHRRNYEFHPDFYYFSLNYNKVTPEGRRYRDEKSDEYRPHKQQPKVFLRRVQRFYRDMLDPPSTHFITVTPEMYLDPDSEEYAPFLEARWSYNRERPSQNNNNGHISKRQRQREQQ